MEEEKKRKKLRKILLIVVLIVAAAVYGTVSRSAEQEVSVSAGNDSQTEEISANQSEGDTGKKGAEEEESEPEKKTMIYVDVGGAVAHPGVVSVAEGSRVFEVIEAAGGTTSAAETKYLNMASECSDGQKLYIPTVSEAEDAMKSGGSDLFSADPSALLPGNSESKEESKVNINTATAEELQTLSGIGPSMAQRIIEYRQSNGPFKSVEDLTNVSGIGEKTLEKFVSKIYV